MSGERRSRRAKAKVVDYAKEQDFSDGDGDVFEDSPSEEPTPKRGRPKGSTSSNRKPRRRNKSSTPSHYEEDDYNGYDDMPGAGKPVYTERGYDPSLLPIRERFPFLPELEADGSPRIDLIVGRRPIDEKGATGDGDNNDSGDANSDESDSENDDSDNNTRSTRGRRGKKTEEKPNKKRESQSTEMVEYEYLIKYKNRSYLHLEWKSGADLESMNKSAKTIYRRYVKRIAKNQDEEMESPEFDASFALPQKIVAESEQEITLELSDKELLEWEKRREKELAEESDDTDEEEKAEKEESSSKDGKEDAEKEKETAENGEKEVDTGWGDEEVDFSELTIERLRKVLSKDGPYYPVFEGCDNPYRDGYVTEPPKKPRASYLFFQCTMRSYFAKRNQKASQGELMTILGNQWGKMTTEEQGPFLALAKEESKQHEKEKALMERAQRPNEMWQPQRRCLMVLNRLVEDGFANIFLEPVDMDDFPDYDELIDQPMDLGTVRERLKAKKYQAPEQFARDVRKVWNNCKIYNRHGSAIWHVADYMSKQFERLYHAWVLDYRERYLRWANPKARPWEQSCRMTDGKCGTADDDTILCDYCDAVYGYKCLKPPLKKPPKGVWHCPDCRPKRKSRGTRMFSAQSEQAARKRAELGDTPKKQVKQKMYLVKWQGLGYEFCTWETKEDIGKPGLITNFHKMNNSFPDEPDMPEDTLDTVLNEEKHINLTNAGGKFCMPDLRTQLYAQTRAFQFTKFGSDVPATVCKECGPISKSFGSPGAPDENGACAAEIEACLSELVSRVAQQDSLQQLIKINAQLAPRLLGEYDTIVPITAKGLLMNVGEIHGSVAFLGYRPFPDGGKGPAEVKKLIRSVGDKIIAVDGVSTVGKSFKEVIGLLRESGKNKYAFMRFMENRFAACDNDLTSVGGTGRYAFGELQNKFSMDRKRLVVNRTSIVEGEEVAEEEEEAESDASANPDDDSDEEDSEASGADFQPDSDDEEMAADGSKESTEDVLHGKTDEKRVVDTVAPASSDEKKEAIDESLITRSETTRSLAFRLLDVDVGNSSDEGGDEDCVYYIDGVDDTFTTIADVSEEIPETAKPQKNSIKGKEKEKVLPVRRSDYSILGDRAKMVASMALTSKAPDMDRFDNFPMESTKARREREEKQIQEEKSKAEALESPDKSVKRSTVKVEQIDTTSNEILHIWASAQAAAATLQLNLNELRQILQADYDESLGDEIGGFKWRYAAAGATVTAGLSESKRNKKGKEAWMEFRDRLYDPTEPHVYKNSNRLRDYQVEGVNWLASTYYRKQGCILADEMGLGKTVQIVAYLEHLSRAEKILRPFLVVVPLSTVEHWRREFEGWTDMVCCVYHDRQRVWRDVLREYEWYYEDRPHTFEYLKFDVLVTTYDTLIGDFDVINQIPFRCAIVDEAHRLRNQKGKLLECMKEISARGTLHYGFQSRVLMSGTPLQNDLIELWTLLNFIEPFKFPDLDNFMLQFGNMANRDQVEALQQKISPFMLRRVKEDVAKDIPSKEETVIDVELTSIQKKYYRAIFEHNHAFLNMGSTRATAPKLMNIQMELRKCCNHPCLLEGVEHRENDTQFKRFLDEGQFEGKTPAEQQKMLNEHVYIQTSGKMVLLDKLLPKLRRENHKILVFSQMVRMLDLISEYCDFREFPYERLDGRVRGTDRQKSIDRFERDPNSFLFLLSTRAGGVGINLTAADVCIIFDSDWNPQNDVQAQARCHRIGQTKDVRIYRLVTSRSFEQEMFDRASKKLGLEQAVLGTFGHDDEDDKPTNKEMEQLLKKGAYALLEDDEDTKQFCADDIDSILAKRTRTRVVEGAKTASWLNKQGMVVSKSKFTADSKSADLDVDDPLFWQKVMPDFVTPHIMLQKLHDLSDEVFGTKRGPGRGRGRGRWKKKTEDAETEEDTETKSAPADDTVMDTDKEPTKAKENEEPKDPIEEEPEEEEKSEDAMEVDDSGGDEDDEEEEKTFKLSKTYKKKAATYVADLKAMMEGIFDDLEDDNLNSDVKQECQKLLLTISVKEKLFNEDQRHDARSMLKKLEGSRRRRCRTSDRPQELQSPGRRGRQEIREELRIVSSKKKRKKQRRQRDDDDSEVGDDGYKVHSDDEADWSDIDDDIYSGKTSRPTISTKEANRRRQWAAGDDAAAAAGRAWPALPRDMVKAVLGSLMEEVLKIDESQGGVFSVPVPPDDFPEYYEQIKKPMDYGTMHQKLRNGEYRSAQAMQKDFVLVMQNCVKFNSADSEIVQEARQQTLMRPKLLRSAAKKHDLFLAEDGSVLEILDDSKKKKTGKKGHKKGDGNENGGKKKRRQKKKAQEEIVVSEEEDDEPLVSMKKKKPPLDSTESGDEKAPNRKRERSTPDESEDASEDDVEETKNAATKPKRKTNSRKGKSEEPARKRRKRGAPADDEEVDEMQASSEGEESTLSKFFKEGFLKKEREALDDSFESAKTNCKRFGPWKWPPSLTNSKFKDIALSTIQKMSKFDRYSVFAEPVDEEEAPNYYEIVKTPMDLATMKKKVEKGGYGEGDTAATALYTDFLLMFDNCRLYNDDDGDVIDEAARLLGLLPETYASQCISLQKKQKKKT